MEKYKTTVIMKRNIAECGERVRKETGITINNAQLLGEHEGDTVENVIELHKQGFSIMPTTEFLMNLKSNTI